MEGMTCHIRLVATWLHYLAEALKCSNKFKPNRAGVLRLKFAILFSARRVRSSEQPLI